MTTYSTSRMDVAELKELASGRWIELLSELGGISPEILDGRHHPCPKCGGVDRFRMIDEAVGALYCNQCFDHGNGDGIAALAWLRGCTLGAAIRLIADRLSVPQDSCQSRGTHSQPGKRKQQKPKTLYASPEEATRVAERASQGRCVASWSYTDPNGSEMFRVIRIDQPAVDGRGKPAKEFRPIVWTEFGWTIGGLPEVRPLYRLLDLVGGETVFVVEGEKCVEALRQLGVTATTSACGSGSASKSDWTPLQRFQRIVIIPDNDASGQKYLQDVARILTQLQPTPEINVARLPGVELGGDVVDWLEQHSEAAAEDLKKQLFELAEPMGVHETIAWPDLIEAEDVPVPAFPLEVFPAVIAQFAQRISDTLQTPLDLASFYCLAALSAAIARKFVVSIPSKSWIETCNLYLVSVLDVGNRKSAACKLCTAPIVAYEADLRAESHQAVVNHNAKRRMLEAKLKSLETKAARLDGAQADKLIGEAQDISWELATMPIRTLPSMLCDDATPQALEATIHTNGERIALLSAEGGIFDILSGRWSKGQYDLDLVLKAHCGDPCRTKRITRGEVVLQQPTITFGLSIQPEKLKGIAGDRTFAGLGLLARFLWCVPTSTVGHRETRPPKLDPKVDAAYKNLIYELCAIPTPEDPLPMPLSPEAEVAHDRFQGAIERRLAPGRDLSGLHGWPNKLVGHSLRIAALLHFARHGRHGANHEIGILDVNAAIQLCESYLIPHASKAFGIAHADDRVADAEWIRSWIRRHGHAEFDRTTLHRDGQRRFYGDKLRLSAALDWMVGAGMLAVLPEKARSAGRKPAPRYAVNPRILNPEKR